MMTMTTANPFYGVDGNLLVEDMEFSRESVEDVLNDVFVPKFYAQVFMPSVLLRRYPQLHAERAKRAHRKAYRARLEAKRQSLRSGPRSPG